VTSSKIIGRERGALNDIDFIFHDAAAPRKIEAAQSVRSGD